MSIDELLALTGMVRPTLYRHLRAYARAGRAGADRRGRWRALTPSDKSGRDGRPRPSRPDSPQRPPTGHARRPLIVAALIAAATGVTRANV